MRVLTKLQAFGITLFMEYSHHKSEAVKHEGLKNAFAAGALAVAIAVGSYVGYEAHQVAGNTQPSVTRLNDSILNGHPDQ